MLKIYGSSEALTEGKIATFETWLGCRLPDDYRIFLLKQNGGFSNLTSFEYMEHGEKEIGGISRFYSIVENEPLNSIQKYRIFFTEDGLSETLLPIAHDHVGNFIFLTIHGAERGKVYYMLHELPDTENLFLVANTFSEFIGKLFRSEDDE
jgi:cell wall assembly regulator SMI1